MQKGGRIKTNNKKHGSRKQVQEDRIQTDRNEAKRKRRERGRNQEEKREKEEEKAMKQIPREPCRSQPNWSQYGEVHSQTRTMSIPSPRTKSERMD